MEVDRVPLQSWQCDSCGGAVGRDGHVVWRYDDNGLYRDFRLVHKVALSPDGRSCDPGYTADGGAHIDFPAVTDIEHLTGPDGLSYLLSFLSAGPLIVGDIPERDRNQVGDMTGLVDLVRRLHVPYYEEARSRFPDSDVLERFADASEAFQA